MRLSVAQIRAILRRHQILDLGTKEELITRVQLLKAGYLEAAFSREHLCILHMIEVVMTIRSRQEELSSTPCKSFCRKRKYANDRKIPSQPGHQASKTLFFIILKTNSGV